MKTNHSVQAEPYTRLITINTVDKEQPLVEGFKLLVDWRLLFGLENSLYPTNLVKVEHYTHRNAERTLAKEIDYVISEEEEGYTIHPTSGKPSIQVSIDISNCGDFLRLEQVGPGVLEPFETVVCFYLEPQDPGA